MLSQHEFSPERVEFHGTAREWFGIWIVNIVLTILTLGIYSAWAKVRKNKYFSQNTTIAGRRFDYHATGLQILIGRIIVIVGLVVFSLLSAIPLVAVVLVIALFVLIPWLMVRALAFNARMHSWSNVRFGFDGRMGGAFLIYMLYPVLVALTAYLAAPFLVRAIKRYVLNNHRLGTSAFSFDAPIGPFYFAFLVAFAWVAGVTAVIGAVALSQLGSFDLAGMAVDPQATLVLVASFYVWIFVAFFPAATIYQAFVRNVTFNNLTLEGGHSFVSTVVPLRLVWIAMSNALAVVLTLGLMLPWAQVRMARYLADHTVVVPGSSLDRFAGQLEARQGAIGDAYGDIESIDLGLPV
jgi:uncharacterized membrane protein YjgN (DUF898 family)